MSVPTVDAIDGLLAWVSKVEQGAASRNEICTHQGPYLAAIPTQIAGLEVPVLGKLSAAVDEAAVEIAHFDEQMGADIAPFAALLLRCVSAASSQIENLTASARAMTAAIDFFGDLSTGCRDVG